MEKETKQACARKFELLRSIPMRLARLFFGIAILLCALVPAHAQDYSKFLFNVGGVIGFPLGNLSNFVNDGGSKARQ